MRRFFITLSVLLLVVAALGMSVVSVQGRIMSAKVASSSSLSKSSSSTSSHISSSVLVQSSSLPAKPSASLRLPILVYHHVRAASPYPKTTWSWKMSVTPSVFAKQMQWIADHGYTTVTMQTAVQILTGVRAGPVKPLAITFDDGNKNILTAALPILQQHGFVGTWYIILQRFGAADFLSKDDVKSLSAQGMEIGSHTMTHAELPVISAADRTWELTESKKELEALVGKPVVDLAYPLTMQNQTVRDATKAAGYISGTIMDPRTATPADDVFKLPRIMMTDDTDLAKTLP